VDFGQHGTLLREPLIAPSTDSHSIQTDEKDLAESTVVAVAAAGPPPDKSCDTDRNERNVVCDTPGRCYNITLIFFAILLAVVVAIALPLWLIPSGTG